MGNWGTSISSSSSSASSNVDQDLILWTEDLDFEEDPVYTKQAIASQISNNIVPEMYDSHPKPYCIWYYLGSEDTYRRLARRYPEMRYHVGRACAAAGYAKLYFELNLLPDISIAEEARDARDAGAPDVDVAGADAIFRAIVEQPVRYAVMDDYTCTVNLENPERRIRVGLNGDTALRSALFADVEKLTPADWSQGLMWFDITGEGVGVNPDMARLPREFAWLLYEPLPVDLPTARKDVLILMAAWEGNVDRYVRLRRPVLAEKRESLAVMRGIQHSTTFAKWWAVHDEEMGRMGCYGRKIRRAVTARFIMDNDLSRVGPEAVDREDVADLIWHPKIPEENTLRELLVRRPNAKMQVIMAAIAGQYTGTYLELKPYISDRSLQRHAMDCGVDLTLSETNGSGFPQLQLSPRCQERSRDLPGGLDGNFWFDDGGGQYGYAWTKGYNRIAEEMARWELYVCAPDGLREQAAVAGGTELYWEWNMIDTWRDSLPWNRRDEGKEGSKQ
ncbi:hypothetical protein CGMCC3_g10001 [Colletotrichum fructicola]|uniref:Uncharacterized protein n=1 Tax=Colletotrichum fructicola (strain Nara gc5) TaxID=1213859 RepID=L2G5X1_COLFN|nr:uncharacterized protein CGMCC3_g10001 [Colletotrichum fructicola]KAE9574150.1 hypothetical protein CGMCC3_g10001 [Colletotrichum fructicola]KAF4430701.1 hypothetical protein CFRS1_v009483 [Colletotrichum fructicola]KAF4483106.1 hypothetical protein CGGC5_v009940 [Colletotrichum fructicola Nara gc5]